MKKKRTILVMTAGLIALGFLAAAGNYIWFQKPMPRIPEAKAELRTLYERYTKGALYLKGIIRLYDKESNVLKEENTFQFMKEKDQLYMQLSYLQTFVANGLMVELDTANRYIVVSQVEDPASMGGNPLLLLDSLFSETAPFKIAGSVTATDAVRSLRLTSDLNPEIKSFTITYDTASYRIRQTEIEWWKEAATREETRENQVWLARITYTYLPGPVLQAKDEIDNIITVTKRKVQPTSRYQDYQLHSRF